MKCSDVQLHKKKKGFYFKAETLCLQWLPLNVTAHAEWAQNKWNSTLSTSILQRRKDEGLIKNNIFDVFPCFIPLGWIWIPYSKLPPDIYLLHYYSHSRALLEKSGYRPLDYNVKKSYITELWHIGLLAPFDLSLNTHLFKKKENDRHFWIQYANPGHVNKFSHYII